MNLMKDVDEHIKNDFIAVYNIVFDSNGNINACGRDTTKRLILLSEQLGDCLHLGSVDYGNVYSGYMNVAVIKTLRTKVER